jgi:hypothetical protein
MDEPTRVEWEPIGLATPAQAIDVDAAVVDRVLERLRRIEELRGVVTSDVRELAESAPPRLLDELRHLVVEAEEWARLDGDERARAAVAELAEATASATEVKPVIATR